MESSGPSTGKTRRNRRVHTRAVWQAGIHQRRGFVHPTPDARHDLFNDAQQVAPAFIRRVAGHLLHPGFVGMSGNPRRADAPTLQLNEEQNTIRHQPSPREHFDREEINPGQNCHVGLNELSPGRVLTPFGRRLNAVPPEDVADCLVGHVVTQVGERANDSIVF
jgi:hypothetical protein